MAFFTLNAPAKLPAAPIQQATSEVSSYCQIVDGADAPTFQAPADDVSKVGWDDQDRSRGTLVRDPEGCGGDRHLLRGKVTYKLIRKNVPLTNTDVKRHDFNWDDGSCHFDTAEKLGIDIPEVDKTKYKVFYPEISGEISIDRLLESRTRGGERSLMYFIDYGLVFLLHINPDGSLTELKGGTTQGQSETFVLADIYQDIDSNRPDLPEEALSCDSSRGAAIAKGPSVIQPPQQISTDSSQLQLQYFVFGTSVGSSEVVNGWGIHCKPAIYLYPNQKQLVNVKVHTKGHLTYVDPPYDNQKGWTVEANPDGSLYEAINHQPSAIRKYPYLYYESKLPRALVKKPETGWVIKKEKLSEFFKQTMPKLGLNAKETKDFDEYWSKTLNSHPYFYVGVLDQGLINYLEPLQIEPEPDSINRVRLYFEGLDSEIAVQSPTLASYNQPKNPNLHVSEWGGVVDTGKDQLFVCNQ